MPNNPNGANEDGGSLHVGRRSLRGYGKLVICIQSITFLLNVNQINFELKKIWRQCMGRIDRDV